MSNRDVFFTRDASVLAAVRVLAEQFPEQQVKVSTVLEAAGIIADGYARHEGSLSLAEFTREQFSTWLAW